MKVVCTDNFVLAGSFTDSTGQIFEVNGELANQSGRAQAAVLSGQSMVGFLELQLTNLGLGALFVPLDDNQTPLVGAAVQYEFLRSLSPEALAGLEEERALREEGHAEREREEQYQPRVREYERDLFDYDE